MTDSFNFARTPYIYFGTGKFTLVPNLIKSHFGKTILLLTGKASFIQSKHWEVLVDLLELHKIRWYHYPIPAQPTPELIDLLSEKYRDEYIEAVVAIGGGSVIDTGKAVSAMYYSKDSVVNYLERIGKKESDGRSLPFMAIPTTAGTGSETTNYAHITKVGKDGFRDKLAHYHYMPEISVIDASLTLTCPPFLTATSGFAAFTQLLEPFLSLGGNQLTDSFAYKGITHLSKNLLKSYKNGKRLQFREGLSYAAMASGIALSNAGYGTVQGLANAVGSRFNIPHRILCAILMQKTNERTIKQLKHYDPASIALQKYNQVGRLLHRSRGKSDDYYRDILIETLGNWKELFKIPNLSDFGVQSKDIPDIIKEVDNGNNPMPLFADDLAYVLESVL